MAARLPNDEPYAALHESYDYNDDEVRFMRNAHSYLPSKLSEFIQDA